MAEIDVLRQEVQEFQERWNSMVLDITEDFKITCEEARTVHDWLGRERKAYAVLKKRINLQIRTIRNDYERRLTEEDNRTTAKAQRVERDLKIQPLKALALAVDELLLKGDEMKLRAERLIEQCKGDEG